MAAVVFGAMGTKLALEEPNVIEKPGRNSGFCVDPCLAFGGGGFTFGRLRE